jgi:diguanylate cyclase (GGDEF)-like protein/PAS domain S-box-containing protein
MRDDACIQQNDLREDSTRAGRPVNVRSDARVPRGRLLDRDALLSRGASHSLGESARAAQQALASREAGLGRRHHPVSRRALLVAAFVLAAAIPTLVLIALAHPILADVAPGVPYASLVVPLLVLLASGTFGAGFGLVVTRLVGPQLDALARSSDAVESAALSGGAQVEADRLNGALAVLRAHLADRAGDRVTAGRDSRERYELAARGSNDGLWDWDLTRDTLYCSPRWHAVVGVQNGGDVVPSSFWFERVHPDDLPGLHDAVEGHVRGEVDHLAYEARMRDDEGVYRWTLCRGLALRREDGRPYRIAGSLTDITERREAEERRLRDALYDPLTGLANRVLLLERLQQALRRMRRPGAHSVVVMLLDVDRFKMVNDSLGHTLGDALLVAIARRLEASVRDVDVLARLGADEIAVVVIDLADDGQVARMAERLLQAFAEPLPVGTHSVFVTASIGVALATVDDQLPDELLRDAETAMYRAKELGRDRYVIFDPSLHGRTAALLALESDFRLALERGELALHYQPIVSADSLAVSGVEALVRWRHPERGLVPPADFIGFAEDSGLIIPLGEWVLRRAIDQMRDWQAAGVAPRRVAVNLSARQLQHRDLAERVAALLDEAGLEPCCLELELTEGVVAEQAETTVEVLRRLRGLGVQLAVDDFGTGYSSLVYLTRFPVSTVKIDRAFLVDIQHDSVNQAIVQAVTTLAHTIGMHVVAEGIETPEQLELARSLGCDEAQGFLVSKPLPADEATIWLSGQHTRTLLQPLAPVSPVSKAG